MSSEATLLWIKQNKRFLTGHCISDLIKVFRDSGVGFELPWNLTNEKFLVYICCKSRFEIRRIRFISYWSSFRYGERSKEAKVDSNGSRWLAKKLLKIWINCRYPCKYCCLIRFKRIACRLSALVSKERVPVWESSLKKIEAFFFVGARVIQNRGCSIRWLTDIGQR